MVNPNADHFDFSEDDDQPLDARTGAINELFKLVKDRSRQLARNATNLGEYVRAFLFDFYSANFEGLAIYHDANKGVTSVDEIERDMELEERITEVEKTSSAIDQMRERLDEFPDKVGYVKVTVRKIRKGDEVRGLRVLAIFPPETNIIRSGFDEDAMQVGGDQQIVYYEPSQACWKNAVDDARKLADENGGVYYLPIQNTEEAQKNIHAGPNGIAEYVVDIDDSGNKIKQSMDSYLWVSLVRRAVGETKHFVVSDFLNRRREL